MTEAREVPVYIVTFYSHRGGVGRTTTLVNVGFELARRGRKVLLVDFDLESPDLTSFPRLRFLPEPHPGVVEYIAAYREKGESPHVTEYLYHPAEAEELKDRLWVMPAGQGDMWAESDPAYWEALAGIDWQELYDRQDGYLFFEDTRAQWEQMELDYVLIDAHAGITPALGISTRQLPDAVVHMFNSRHGGLGGLDEMYWRISDEKQTRGKSIEQFHVAVGVVEADDEEASDFKDWDAAVPFSHRLLLKKQVIVDAKADDRLAREYRRLANVLIEANFAQHRDGALLLLRKLLADPSKVIERAIDLDRIIDRYQKDPVIQAQAACCLYGAERCVRALEVLDQAVKLRPKSPELLWQRASYRRQWNMTRDAVSDLLTLLDVCDPPKRDRSAGSEEDQLYRVLDPVLDLGFDWRFALPGERPEEVAAFVRDYSDTLLSLPGIDRYVASAVRRLQQLSTEAYEEAKRKPAVAALSPFAQALLFGDLLPPDRGVDANLRDLVHSHQWDVLVQRLQRHVKESDWPRLEDAILLFLAWWGRADEQELQACGKKATELFHEMLQTTPQMLSAGELQIMAVIFWKTGDGDYARKILDAIDARPEEQRILSYWQGYHPVIWKLFKKDCDRIRQLFNDRPIRPPFLGREPASR